MGYHGEGERQCPAGHKRHHDATGDLERFHYKYSAIEQKDGYLDNAEIWGSNN